jgi:hypothetical protein
VANGAQCQWKAVVYEKLHSLILFKERIFPSRDIGTKIQDAMSNLMTSEDLQTETLFVRCVSWSNNEGLHGIWDSTAAILLQTSQLYDQGCAGGCGCRECFGQPDKKHFRGGP